MKHFSAALFFAFLTLFFLSPEIVFDPSYVIGRETRDLYDHLALLDQWSLELSEWSFPTGGTLVPPDVFSMIFAFPFMGLGRGIAFDIALWIQLWLCCMSGYAVGGQVGSGLVGGVVFGFSPFVMGQLFSGETETLNGWTLGFFLAVYMRNPYSLWVGFWMAMSCLGAWYYGIYGLFCWAFATVLRRPWSANNRSILYPFCIFSLLIAIPAWTYKSILTRSDQLFRGPTMADYLENNPRALASFSVDPSVWFGWERVDVGHQDGFGMLVVMLACVGVIHIYRTEGNTARLILGMIVISLLFSLGPVLHWKSEPIFRWMPYRLLVDLPIVGLMRLPHRWLIVATLLISMLAASGGRRLVGMWIVLLLFQGLYMNDVVRYSVNIQPPNIISLYEGAVLELPARTMDMDLRGRYLLWQRTHRQPTAFSLLMQGWSPKLDNEPLLIAVTAADRKDPISVRTAEAEQFRKGEFAVAVQEWRKEQDWSRLARSKNRLVEMGFRQVVLFPEALAKQDALEIQRILEAALGRPFIEQEDVLLWKF